MYALALPFFPVKPMSDETDRLLKEFLQTQRREERKRFEEQESVKETVTNSAEKVFGAMQALSIDVSNKIESFSKEFRGELKKTNFRV